MWSGKKKHVVQGRTLFLGRLGRGISCWEERGERTLWGFLCGCGGLRVPERGVPKKERLLVGVGEDLNFINGGKK